MSEIDQRLIFLYGRRKGLRLALINTHDTIDDGSTELPRVLRLNLTEEAVKKRAQLWPLLDDTNARIRKFKKTREEREVDMKRGQEMAQNGPSVPKRQMELPGIERA